MTLSGQSEALAPGLLIAMPQLADPNFEHTVALMIEHRGEGSFGLVLNRPAKLTVASLLRSLDIAWAGDPEAVVNVGGPVMTGTGWIVHEPMADVPEEPGTMLVAPDIALSMSVGSLRTIAARPPRRLRFFLGYAGWGPGQLAEEMVSGAWLHVAATPELVFETPAERLWERALHSLGVDPAALVPTRGLQ